MTIFKAIEVSQMEKELEKKMEFVNKRSRLLGTAATMQLEDENVKEILREVLNELYSKKTKGVNSR